MTNNQRRLVQKLVRYMNASEAIEQRMYESMEIDAAFDGGEFSGPALARAARRQMTAAAVRLGFASAVVAEQIYDRVILGRREQW
jgi:hypothetical protein